MIHLPALLLIAAAGGAAYAGTRRLMQTDADIQRMPEFARPLLYRKRAYLLSARAHFAEAMQAGVEERRAAERDLMQEYHRRTGRR